MARFHAVTWQDGSFERTAAVLSFDSKAARAAYPAQCAQRVQNITHAEMKKHISEGRAHVLGLWDASQPTVFKFVQ